MEKQVSSLKEILKNCTLCPRRCRVDRTRGETGFCGLTAKIVMDCALAHHGEEPPLSGSRGAGTIFFSSCNLGCLYCQNYQISHQVCGRELKPAELAQIMLDLQKQGCHNIEPVTPTPQAPLIMEALQIARSRGLTIPFVYNCGGYEDPQIIKMLDKMVDVYLPDFKYGKEGDGVAFSAAAQYPDFALAALREMARQVGDKLQLRDGIAQRGVIVRHLVLPGHSENSFAALRLIKEVSPRLALSLMSQYTPVAKVRNHPDLGRRITAAEYNQVLDYAFDIGFENIFAQEVSDRELTPDFSRENPFLAPAIK
ncbi:MAG TPA: radical SAM protein [Smithellaceae bacterium]|nr:radical SAM protein [Smithellaceae bacterium]